jgi:acetate kinase
VKVLAINCGSSTLKFSLLEGGVDGANYQRLASGVVDDIGGQGGVRFSVDGGRELQRKAVVSDHGEAARLALGWLSDIGLLRQGLDGVGHRIVHGGSYFSEPVLIDDRVVSIIESIGHLALLHNGPALEAVRAARQVIPRSVPQVAVFDTAFFASIPEFASRYAIPFELVDKYHIRRYGFHGLAHRYMVERYSAITATPMDKTRLITMQLGSGCSATAVSGGRPVDTSMGFTPLEGLMMSTRSGDIDPSLVGFLARREGVDVSEVEDWLNTRSGLLGVSGRSGDMRELLKAEEDKRAMLAMEMFCYRVRKYLGSYLAVLGGANGIIFGGGIGENSPEVRASICSGMEWCGLTLDEERNRAAVGVEARISSDQARMEAYVIPVDEGIIIARETVRYLSDKT